MDKRLPADLIPLFNEGIALVVYRWSALRTAVENEWGGRDSRQKAEQLCTDLLSWFIQAKESLYIYDLEEMLDEGLLSLNVEVEDGSIEEVAERLMIMHEEFLEGNFKSIEILREANLKEATRPRAVQVMNNVDDDEEDQVMVGDESSNMMTDMPNPESKSNTVDTSFNGSIPKAADEADDGWIQVSSRRNKGRKN